MHEPHRLRNGDRLEIGQYIVSVMLDGEGRRRRRAPGERPCAAVARRHPSELWGVAGEVAPPVWPRGICSLHRPAAAPHPDFLDWVVDVPDAQPGEPVFRPAPRQAEPFTPPPPPRAPAPDPNAYAPGPAFAPSPFAGSTASPFAEPAPSPFAEPAAPMPSPRRPSAAAQFPLMMPGGASPLWRPSQHGGFAPTVAERRTRLRAAGARLRSAEPPHSPPPVAPTAYAPPPVEAPPPGRQAVRMADFLQRLARARAWSRTSSAGRIRARWPRSSGLLMRLVAENMKQLLGARAETRAMMRTARQTMIEAIDNNPPKLSSTAEDALRMMFGPRTGVTSSARTLHPELRRPEKPIRSRLRRGRCSTGAEAC